MIRFSTKALLIAAFALTAFIATAPTASADGGTLEVNNSSFALSNFDIKGHKVDADFQLGSGAWLILLEGAFNDVNSFSIVSNGITYTFTGVDIKKWDVGKNGWDIDFKFKGESTSSSALPEPATIMLVGCGLLALALYSSRKALRA